MKSIKYTRCGLICDSSQVVILEEPSLALGIEPSAKEVPSRMTFLKRALRINPKAVYLSVIVTAFAGMLSAQTPAKFTSPAPKVSSGFGSTIVTSGDNVLIGAPLENVVYLFEGSTRTFRRAFTISVSDAGALFGRAIAVADSLVIIGAPLSDAGGVDAGAVFIFDLNTGALLDTLLKPVPALDDSFGFSLAIAGSKLIVGAPRDDAAANNAGAVHVFSLVSGAFDTTIQNPQDDPNDFFGFAIAALGDDFIVGAHSTEIFSSDAGTVYFYHGADFDSLNTLDGSDYDDAVLGFGFALATTSRDFIVGTLSGEVYLLTPPAGALRRKYTSGGALFGRAVSGSDRQILVGATDGDGSAFLFDSTSTNPLETFSTNTSPSDLFGSAVAFFGNDVLVGAPGANNTTGAVYIFDSANRAPVVQAIPDQTMDEGSILDVPVSATDPDGDVLRLVIKNLPAFAGFTDNGDGSGTIRFAPSFNDAKIYPNIQAIVFDDGAPNLSDTTSFTLTVNDVGRPPVLQPINDLTMDEGDSLDVPVSATDPDGDVLRLVIDNLPAFAGFTDNGNGAGTIRFAPSLNDAGVYSNIQAIAFDDGAPNLSDTTSFTLTVNDKIPLLCQIEITSPQEGFRVQHDLVLVTGRVTANAPGSLSRCAINDVPASIRGNQFSALAPLSLAGKNLLIAQAVFIGASSDTAFCADSLSVFRIDPLACEVKIVSPDSGADVFGDSVRACLTATITGGHNPVRFSETINGRQVDANNPACVQVPLTLGSQSLLAETIHLDDAASDSFAISINALGTVPDGPQLVRAGVEFNAARDASGNLIPISAFDADQNGAVEIVFSESNVSGILASIVFPSARFGPGPTQVWITASTEDSLSFRAFDPNGVLLSSAIDTVQNDFVQTFRLAGGAIRRIDLIGQNFFISELSYTGAVKLDTVTCQDSISVNVFPIITDVVLNEISFDPNYDDFDALRNVGTERIELKNIGSDSARFDNWALIAVRDTLVTAWKFPRNVKLAPGGLLVVHWLANGTDDAGNLFTGLPSVASPDSFFGNNSTIATDMTLGGVANDNSKPFALFLMQLGSQQYGTYYVTTSLVSAPRLVDFVQIGNVVPSAESFAVQAGLWKSGDFLASAKSEGFSYELLAQPSDSVLTSSSDYFKQANPSLGFANKLVGPAPQHLLISEVCVRPGFAEFIEIYNPGPGAVSLKDYYLTDNVKLRNNAYTLLTKGLASLDIDSTDFFVRFPATAVIAAGAYHTVAFSAKDFAGRYSTVSAPRAATYEIIGNDGNPANNMRLVKPDTTTQFANPNLADPNEVLILLRWDGKSDLVEDVDYIVWGDTSLVAGAASKTGDIEAGEQASGTIIAGPLNEAVNKTGLGVDGADSSLVKSYYDNEADFKQQKPVGRQTHALLKSWQRRPSPREFGELRAGGNGMTGHDETSENLADALEEDTPTPNEANAQLDLVFDGAIVEEDSAAGLPNGLVSAGEVINLRVRLRNRSTAATGPLFTVLRSVDGLDIIGADSTALFPSILPDSSELSLDFYIFTAQDEILPDSLRFILRVVQKSGSAPQKAAELDLAQSAVQEVFIPFQLATTRVILSARFNGTLLPTSIGTDTLQLKLKLAAMGRRNSRGQELFQNAVNTTVTIVAIDSTVLQSSLPPFDLPFGTLPIYAPALTDSLKFLLPDSLSGQSSHVRLHFSWLEQAGPRNFFYNTFFSSPDTIIVSGNVSYYLNQGALDTATVILRCPGFADTTRTDSTGAYSFTLTFSINDDGSFASDRGLQNRQTFFTNQTVNLCTLEVRYSFIPPDAVTAADVQLALDLAMDAMGGMLAPDILYQLLAMDVDGDSMITLLDADSILQLVCFSQPQTWKFVSGLYPITLNNWQRTPTRMILPLRHYSVRRLNMIGVILGDVDAQWQPAPGPPLQCDQEQVRILDESSFRKEKLDAKPR